ncbi:MAG: serine hydrolase domain-containing protein [Bacteroidota bacterium]
MLLLFFIALGCTKNEKTEHINSPVKKVQELLLKKKYNGSFLYTKKGEKIMDLYIGYRDIAKKDTLRAEHVFYLASVSKQITAMACLILVHKGELSLENKLSAYFPELSYADKVSIRQMLNHSSGIPDYYGLGVYKAGMKNINVVNALLDDTELEFEPDSKFAYSNSAYVLLAMVVEKVSGKSFATFVKEEIFTPLEMESSVVFDEHASPIPIRAIGHSKQGEKKDYAAFTTGGGGIFSQATDLCRWERALYTEKLIPQGLLAEAYAPLQLKDGTTSYYGMGWFVEENDPQIVWHTGSLEGFRNLMYRNTKDQSLYLFLTNNSFENLPDLQKEIAEIIEQP